MREERREQEQRQEQGQENGERSPRRVRPPKRLLSFIGILLLECVFAAAFLMLLSYVCFRLRFSTEVIRAGLVLAYLLPCLLGGRAARLAGLRPAMLWGVGVGLMYFCVLFALSFFSSDAATVEIGIPILCALGGAAGALPGKKSRSSRKSGPIS